jgi:hypothetical protein
MTRQEVEAITKATRKVSRAFRQLRRRMVEVGAPWRSGEIEGVSPLTRARAEDDFARMDGLIKRVLPLLGLYFSPCDG